MLKATKEALRLSGHRIHEIWPLTTTTIGTFKVKPFLVKHDVQCCGFYMVSEAGEKAVYLTDAAYTPYVFPALDILAVEVNYDLETIHASNIDPARKRRVMLNHLSLHNVLELLKSNDLSRLKEIHVLHLSDANANEARIKREIQKVAGCPVYVASA